MWALTHGKADFLSTCIICFYFNCLLKNLVVQLHQPANKINLVEIMCRYVNYFSIAAIKQHEQKQLIGGMLTWTESSEWQVPADRAAGTRNWELQLNHEYKTDHNWMCCQTINIQDLSSNDIPLPTRLSPTLPKPSHQVGPAVNIRACKGHSYSNHCTRH